MNTHPSGLRLRAPRVNDPGQSCGLARVLSKLGFCSRSQAWELVKAGRVQVNGVVWRDPERRVDLRRDRIEADGAAVRAEEKIYLMLNKPRGLITTTSDERGRETVFQCLEGNWKDQPVAGPKPEGGAAPLLPRVVPVGRLDKASEGLLLFTNDTAWAACVTAPESHLDKTYHVQVDCLADDALIRRMTDGVAADGDFLAAKRVNVLRCGQKNSWLELVIDEGKNRHIRRLLAAFGVNVLRLVRVAIGPLQLGSLAKGGFRHLTREEIRVMANPAPTRGLR
jgi:23S rRNA pseudouridine2605 synthase